MLVYSHLTHIVVVCAPFDSILFSILSLLQWLHFVWLNDIPYKIVRKSYKGAYIRVDTLVYFI